MGCLDNILLFLLGDRLSDLIEAQINVDKTKRDLESKEKQLEEITTAADTKGKLQADLEKRLQELMQQKHKEVDEEIVLLRKKLADGEKEISQLKTEKTELSRLYGEHNGKFDDLQNQVDKNLAIKSSDSLDHNLGPMQRAWTKDWESLRAMEKLDIEQFSVVEKENFRMQAKTVEKPPKLQGQSYRDWQEDVYKWAAKLIPLHKSMDELGEALIKESFEGHPSERRIARRAPKSPDLSSIMIELEQEASPLIEQVHREMQRLIPKLRRPAGCTPLVWFNLMKDLFVMEEEVFGENYRTDETKHEHTLTSMFLERVTEQQLRSFFDRRASNNFPHLKAVLQRLSIKDAALYDKRTNKPFNKHDDNTDYMEEALGVFGESSLLRSDATHLVELNKYYSQIKAQAYITGGMSGPSGANTPRQQGGNTPRPEQMSKEELQKLRDTPRRFGKNCQNLLNKGSCIRKHTKEELFHCKGIWEKNNPEEAKKRKEWQEQQKKKQAEAAKKKREAEKAGASSSSTS
eukprot:g18641.t1